MDVWQASLMRAFATQLAREQGELEEGDEAGGEAWTDDDGWEDVPADEEEEEAAAEAA